MPLGVKYFLVEKTWISLEMMEGKGKYHASPITQARTMWEIPLYTDTANISLCMLLKQVWGKTWCICASKGEFSAA